METELLERPADLAVWSARPGDTLIEPPVHYRSLREALQAAAGLLADPSKQPWIVTEDGEMLAPVCIRSYLN